MIFQVTPENASQIVDVNEGADLIGISIEYLISGMGEALFGLFIGAFVFYMLYYASGGSIGVPAIVITLASAWLMSVVPPQYRTIVATIVIVGIGAGVFRIIQRYHLRPDV